MHFMYLYALKAHSKKLNVYKRPAFVRLAFTEVRKKYNKFTLEST